MSKATMLVDAMDAVCEKAKEINAKAKALLAEVQPFAMKKKAEDLLNADADRVLALAGRLVELRMELDALNKNCEDLKRRTS